uniref:Homing endonuclease LAGLIDADG domain-containing protein n=1 Tax=Arthrobotrys musiformis TaxID=47236 RepID=A0A482EAM6_9PEZI|nr:hypothetical protein [Arthrobotrys musiformis]QBM31498.1 hypothetical protein [Arthrobotrys musiformis]QBM31572.1 hypothetical protein [Arthrobotrys musiformis]QBM31648.1 hypothetical protein [Arthrobotrys musiformis]
MDVPVLIYINQLLKQLMNLKLIFQLTQHIRDEQLIKQLIEYFDCGFFVKHNNAYFREKFSDIENKIIPFFLKNPVKRVKFLDYKYWCQAAELIKNKAHLTEKWVR